MRVFILNLFVGSLIASSTANCISDDVNPNVFNQNENVEYDDQNVDYENQHVEYGNQNVHNHNTIEWKVNEWTINITCSSIDDTFESKFVRRIHTMRNDFRTFLSENEMYSNNEVAYMLPVNLIYKDLYYQKDMHSIPQISRPHQEFTIFALDLSSNDLDEVPVFREMRNLRKLDISKNRVVDAKFYSEFNLPYLTKLSYSENVISRISADGPYPFSQLKHVNLSHNYLIDLEESSFAKMADLEELDLSHNFIDMLNVLSFEGVKKLLYLDLSYNRLTEVNQAFVRFTEIKYLVFTHNKIEMLKEKDFYKMSNLENLDISNNILVDIEENTFKHMSRLLDIDLSFNMLTSLGITLFKNLTALKSVNLSNNRIKALPLGFFCNNIHIVKFNIQNNTIEGSLSKGSFDGLRLVTSLDLSYQQISTIEDNAFFGMSSLRMIRLDHNKIHSISNKSFGYLYNLLQLDLSDNQIQVIEFAKSDLPKIQSLILRRNFITDVDVDTFHDLDSILYLDLSYNNITHFQPNSFSALQETHSFDISNNPLNGVLYPNTFRGLKSVPRLTIAFTSISKISNYTFNEMLSLRELNLSRGSIKELQFNSFTNTSMIETIDLSYNELFEFNINSTDLKTLVNLILSNNKIVTISEQNFYGLGQLYKINDLNLAHNNIHNIDYEIFQSFSDLQRIDFSYNAKLKCNILFIQKQKHLLQLIISGTDSDVTFHEVSDTSLTDIEFSYANIVNISSLCLTRLSNVEKLALSKNKIATLETNAFQNMTQLQKLDLSFNSILNIQSNAFKDNSHLSFLNISHNNIKYLAYGSLNGLIHLETMDISYNNVKDMDSQRFFEVPRLRTLIADHNEITSITVEEFFGTELLSISIGHNPIPCDVLVNMKKRPTPFHITSLDSNDAKGEIVAGIVCNKVIDKQIFTEQPITEQNNRNDKLFSAIKELIDKISVKNSTESNNNVSIYLSKISDQIDKAKAENEQRELLSYNTSKSMLNLTFINSNEYRKTNQVLEKILKQMSPKALLKKNEQVPIKNNVSGEELNILLSKLKLDLENRMSLEKENTIREVNDKILAASNRHLSHEATNAKFSNENGPSSPSNTLSIVAITCVAIILMVLCVVLYKMYNSSKYLPQGLSISTHQIVDSFDNSHL